MSSVKSRVIFAAPTYGPVDPQVVAAQRIAIMSALRNGVDMVGDIAPDRIAFAASRNRVVEAALYEAPESDYVFWCDSDIILPPHAIEQLTSHHRDFVSGIYFQRVAPHYPLLAKFNERDDNFTWGVELGGAELTKFDGCGFGCVLTSTRMLRDIKAQGECFQYSERCSEDLFFCLQARKLRYQLWADPAVLCGHLGAPSAVTVETFLKIHREKV